ncbi:MAG TPA: hypothetical protein VF532_04810 [Candidatus Angelobacter sp.]
MNNDAQLDSLVKQMARDHQPEMPSPGVIWWRAQIRKKLAEKERIERPMAIMRLAAALAVVVVFVGMFAANWRQVFSMSEGHAPLLTLLAIAGVAVLAVGLAALRPSSASRS